MKDNKKKILFFLKTPPPITGATLMNERVCNSKYLADSFDVEKIKISYAKSVAQLGVFDLRKILKVIKYYFKLLKSLLINKPYLIYFQLSPTGLSFIRDSLYVLLMKMFKQKIVFHLRGKGIKKYVANKPILKKYYQFIFHNVSVICLSELLTYDIEDIYFETPYIVYNGMPEYNYKCEKKMNDRINILYLSNLIKEKGVWDYIDSLEILKKKGFDFVGTIIGGEADITKEYLLDYLQGKGLQNTITFKGSKYGDDKFKEYCNADIFVFPTYYSVEAFPGVVLEAMQFELPIIAYNEASNPIMIEHNETGFIIQSRNIVGIASKIEKLLKDSDKRILMGKNGKKKYKDKFTFDIFERKLGSVFFDIINKKI